MNVKPLFLFFQLLVTIFCSCYYSGTLSYIFNNFIGNRDFSEVVEEAKQAGYTEPDPRDDLSGTDVARKVNTYILNLISAGHGSGLPISFGALSVTHRVWNLIFGHICIFPLVCYIDCLARTCTINTIWVPSLPVTIWHGWIHWTQIAICLHFFYYKFHAQ